MSTFKEIVARHSIKRTNGQQAIVFGGTSGIGQGIAIALAKANVRVTVVGRDKQRGDEIVQVLKAASNNAHDFIPCDAFLVSKIAEFSRDYSDKHKQLDYLVLSAGIATMDGRTETSEGLDKKLAVHYWSRMAAIQTLLPLLKLSKNDPRVLSVLSAGVHSEYTDYKTDVELKDNYSLSNAANAAGMYNDLAMEALSLENPEVTFVHAAPGIVSTNWGTDLPWYARIPARCLLGLIGRSLEDCGQYMTCGLFDDQFKGGWHLMTKDGERIQPRAYHKAAGPFVWNHTRAVLNRLLPESFKKTSYSEEKSVN
jgi:NAD(P)-dependent dehydrogenase (short-subunit alcohol dehydrogenase family)